MNDELNLTLKADEAASVNAMAKQLPHIADMLNRKQLMRLSLLLDTSKFTAELTKAMQAINKLAGNTAIQSWAVQSSKAVQNAAKTSSEAAKTIQSSISNFISMDLRGIWKQSYSGMKYAPPRSTSAAA